MYGDTKHGRRAACNGVRLVALFIVPFSLTFMLGLFGLGVNINDLVAWSFITSLMSYLFGIIMGTLTFMYGDK